MIDDYFTHDKHNYISLYHSITIIDTTQNLMKSSYVKNRIMSTYSISEKEYQIIEYLIDGNSNQQIAEEMYISINTVRTHIKNIYRKLNINSQRELLTVMQQSNTKKYI